MQKRILLKAPKGFTLLCTTKELSPLFDNNNIRIVQYGDYYQIYYKIYSIMHKSLFPPLYIPKYKLPLDIPNSPILLPHQISNVLWLKHLENNHIYKYEDEIIHIIGDLYINTYTQTFGQNVASSGEINLPFGLLCDPPGYGKKLSILSYISSGNTLIVGKKDDWIAELNKFMPNMQYNNNINTSINGLYIVDKYTPILKSAKWDRVILEDLSYGLPISYKFLVVLSNVWSKLTTFRPIETHIRMNEPICKIIRTREYFTFTPEQHSIYTYVSNRKSENIQQYMCSYVDTKIAMDYAEERYNRIQNAYYLYINASGCKKYRDFYRKDILVYSTMINLLKNNTFNYKFEYLVKLIADNPDKKILIYCKRNDLYKALNSIYPQCIKLPGDIICTHQINSMLEIDKIVIYHSMIYDIGEVCNVIQTKSIEIIELIIKYTHEDIKN